LGRASIPEIGFLNDDAIFPCERLWHTKKMPHQASSPMKRPLGTQGLACGMFPHGFSVGWYESSR
jgi:hypothetical protein